MGGSRSRSNGEQSFKSRLESALRHHVENIPLNERGGSRQSGTLVGDISFRARSMLTPEHVRLSVHGVDTRFSVANVWEYEHFIDYGGGPDGQVLGDFVDRLRPTDVVWDIGANVGVYSCFAAAILTGGTDAVVAIEPLARNVDRIAENLSENDRSAAIYRLALGDSVGTVTVEQNGPDAAGAFGSMVVEERGRAVQAPLTTGKRLVELRGVEPPTVLKVDVQGAEGDVLEGLETLLDDCRLVYCNVYEKHFDSPDDAGAVESLLTAAGFETTRIATWSGGYFIRANGET